jgi:ATP-binding protein involved in chromosome partitioning
MAFFVPEDLPEKKYFIFGQDGGARLAETLGIPLLGQIPLVEDVRTRGDEGNPSSLNSDSPTGKAFASVAAEVARQVAIRNSQTPPTAKVQMQVQ